MRANPWMQREAWYSGFFIPGHTNFLITTLVHAFAFVNKNITNVNFINLTYEHS